MAYAVERRESQLWTENELRELGHRVLDRLGDRGTVAVSSSVQGTTGFARGDVHMVTEKATAGVTMTVHGSSLGTSRLDEESLETAVRRVKAQAEEMHADDLPKSELDPPRDFGPRPKTSFESTEAAIAPAARAEVLDRTLNATEAAGLIGAGDMRFSLFRAVRMNTLGSYRLANRTYGEFSVTARTRDGTGSGWGWAGREDWSRVDPDAVITRAVDLGQRSANPVALEPGRYTVILEPTALAPLLEGIRWAAILADAGQTPFANERRGTNKIGLQMLDRRLGIVSDPWDPDMPRDNWYYVVKGEQVWFEKGVLRDLYFAEEYAAYYDRGPNTDPQGIRLHGEGRTQALEEMIASTERGIWVNRLSNIMGLNDRTFLKTGTTRDGTFLIENGKITKPIKNFRFSESAFFVLNKLEAVGEPVRASKDIICPRVKVRDFNFTSLTDAI